MDVAAAGAAAAATAAFRLASEVGDLLVVDDLLHDVRVNPAAADNVAIYIASKNSHLLLWIACCETRG